ncbi:MAG: hypothetical protein IJD20_00485, partial [Oscillospiraceae bacterium]|nr:hypothetical protein [Oscillospiraceae bacterium]
SGKADLLILRRDADFRPADQQFTHSKRPLFLIFYLCSILHAVPKKASADGYFFKYLCIRSAFSRAGML